MGILIVAEHNNQSIKESTRNTISAAQLIGGETVVLVAGENCRAAAQNAATVEGVTEVLCCDDAIYADGLAENLAQLVVNLAGAYSHILFPATSNGKNVMPRVAALLDVAGISDITAVKSEDTFVRPIYAGNALATVRSKDKTKLITVRTTAFDAAQTTGAGVDVRDIEAAQGSDLVSHVGSDLSVSDRPELTSAKVVISGGRGMKNGENFAMLEGIANKLNAAVGASRAAVDAGFVPNDYQVGQTGKVVAPDLYIAVGISGAIQHLAGMKDSKVIVAINNDEDAPIFQVADYGLVADLFDVLPELEGLL